MLFQLKETVRNLIIRLFMAVKSDVSKSARTGFTPENFERKYIANSSIITVYHSRDQFLFFRECRQHYSMKRYIRECINDYFDNVCNAVDKEQIREGVFCDISDKEKYKKAININAVFNSHLYEILAGVYSDYSATGFESFAKIGNNDEFIAFIKYISCAVITQRTNSYLKCGKYENFNANKQLATYHFARLLGIESLITPVWVCCFNDGKKYRIGTMMNKAEGIPPSEIIPGNRKNYSG